ncbi:MULTISPECIES: metalloregulator ArsR/SmtB family transcription factor [Actinoalloteichus]|uniref:helix-turn-helix transcriptional regulator n=1 Tax=Actinoalloteichus TaxID=65496 RepID=UPI002989C5DC|nr:MULTISPECIES: metalloregulator ArsR/SmtB family transcription factor [Actinoalloteichus]
MPGAVQRARSVPAGGASEMTAAGGPAGPSESSAAGSSDAGSSRLGAAGSQEPPGDLPSGASPAQTPATPVSFSEGRTRHTVARLLLEHGPATAAAIAEELGLGQAAVRRHLDAMIADGQACTRQAPRGPRGRGRPARLYLLTEAGRTRFGHAYDDLAVAALRFLAEHVGEQAVTAFARQRVTELVDRHRGAVSAAPDPATRAEALAEALTREGYASSTRRVGSGEQLCQHHCPVAHVAAEFPQLCEAETALFADLLGTHVQRLATIARGDAACTTHVPLVDRASEHTDRPEQSGGSPTRLVPAPATPVQTAPNPDGGEPA